MSFRGLPIRQRLGRFFPLTLRGALYFSLSLLILAVGVLRMELATLLWGSSFVLLALYCLTANLLYLSILRRHIAGTPDPVDCTLPGSGMFPGTCGSAEISAELPRRIVPGLRSAFEMRLRWHGRAPLVIRAALSPGRNRTTAEVEARHRGCFRAEQARIVVEDLLGFTRSYLSIPLAEKLRVFPALKPAQESRPTSLEGGGQQKRQQRKRRSEELLEVRKYFPGDDIRKIHWKVFAHTDELFLRIGEQTPPPQWRFLVLIDPARSRWVPEPLSADYLDGMVSACASTALQLASAGFQVLFASCHGSPPRQVTVEKSAELLAALAELWYSDRYAMELPRLESCQVLLYSSPGSKNLSRLLREAETRRWSVQLYLKDLRPAERVPKTTTLRDVFLRPRYEKIPEQPPVGNEEMEAFQRALSREIGRLGGRGRRKVLVDKI